MGNPSVPILSLPCLLFVASLLVASGTSSYILNGYRGNSRANNNEVNEEQRQQSNVDINPTHSCVQRVYRDFRPVPGNCKQFTMCWRNALTTYTCPGANGVFSTDVKSCVPQGSRYDKCSLQEVVNPVPEVRPVTQEPKPEPEPTQFNHGRTVMCPRGATYKKAHPVHCARYYDCSKPAMAARWNDHEWECKYPFMFNADTNRCEHYSMVSCGQRKIAYDKCDYKSFSCNGHAHCRPCRVSNPSCRNLKDGMNEWKGRVPSPYYVVCSQNRVVYSGQCPSGQLFDGKTGTCVIEQQNFRTFG